MITRLAKMQSDVNSDRGATAVEYGIMVGFIAAVIVLAVAAFGGSVNGLFLLVTNTAPFK